MPPERSAKTRWHLKRGREGKSTHESHGRFERFDLWSIGLPAGVVFSATGRAICMVNQNVIVTSGTQHSVNGLAELRVLCIECVICLRFRARHSHPGFYLMISILADRRKNRLGKVCERYARFRVGTKESASSLW